ncbi:MAG: exopolysaccharide biosynthesis protein [Elusimicrobia bacterium]|nr:exopolysaccharide biosynthesis protein [Elusimicrobiota bacterium]MDE2512054.1 exopolysaccharide biosynthesis protein [Elusimicrobiota bacterium]
MPAAAHLRRLRETLDGPVTLGELVSRLGREGIGLLVFVLALPFLQPIPLAGLGTPVGLLLIALGLQLIQGRDEPKLPRFVMARRLEKATVDRLLAAAERLLGIIERFARPRWDFAARSPRVYGTSIVFLGLLFAIPVFVPFGNPIAAAPLAALGLAMLEDDGLLGALGVGGTAFAWAYHGAYARLIWAAIRAFMARHG